MWTALAFGLEQSLVIVLTDSTQAVGPPTVSERIVVNYILRGITKRIVVNYIPWEISSGNSRAHPFLFADTSHGNTFTVWQRHLLVISCNVLEVGFRLICLSLLCPSDPCFTLFQRRPKHFRNMTTRKTPRTTNKTNRKTIKKISKASTPVVWFARDNYINRTCHLKQF
jgi:hypothetical protein